MEFIPSNTEDFPEMDRLVLHAICAASNPGVPTENDWILRYSKDKVFLHGVVRDGLRDRKQKGLITRLPHEITQNPKDYVMVHIAADNPYMKELAAKYPDSGIVLNGQLRDSYHLAERSDYTVYHVHHHTSRLKALGKKLLAKNEPDEYALVFTKPAYKALTMQMFEKLVEGNEEVLWGLANKAAVRDAYEEPNSIPYERLRALVENAQLEEKDIRAIIEYALEKQNYEFAAAIREIAADMYPNSGFKHRNAIEAANKAKGIGGGQSPG